jgi:hypothetical protein
MQNPITPIRPEQPGWPISHSRTASTSSKIPPLRGLRSRIAVRRQVSVLPQENRSGAAARYPSLASHWAWLRRSCPMPMASWMTTTPGQGGGSGGTARKTGRSPCPDGIVVSVMRPPQSPAVPAGGTTHGAGLSAKPAQLNHPVRARPGPGPGPVTAGGRAAGTPAGKS